MKKKQKKIEKQIPRFKTDAEAEAFLEQDLSDYINATNFKRVKFEFAPKTETLSLRLSPGLLGALKAASKKRKMSYQRFIRLALESAVDAA